MKEQEEGMSRKSKFSQNHLKMPHYNLRHTLSQFAHTYRYYKMLQPLLQNA